MGMMLGGLSACGGGDGPGDAKLNNSVECPADKPIRCTDDSCATDAPSCPGEDPPDPPDVPETIDGEIVDLSPRTILAHAPEPVDVHLSVSDADRVQTMIDEGATWQVELVDGSGTEMLDAAATPLGADQTDSEQASYDFAVQFTPGLAGGPQHAQVTVKLTDKSGEEFVWGDARLRYRGDVSALDFADREGYRLESLVAPTRGWTPDVDGDGIPDLVIRDVRADAAEPVLRVFKCDGDRCEPAGVAALGSEGGDCCLTPDMIVAPDMIAEAGTSGFLAAMNIRRSDAGVLSKVDVLRLELSTDDTGHTLTDTRATIDLRVAAEGARLHEQTLQPRLFLDRESGAYRPGLLITRTIEGAAGVVWTTMLLDDKGVVAKYGERPKFDSRNDAVISAALDGELATCFPAGASTQIPREIPDGMILSAFGSNEKPMLAVGAIDPADGLMHVFALDQTWDETTTDSYGSASCKFKDLDGDGIEDLAIALASSEVYSKLGADSGAPAALLIAKGLAQADVKRAMAEPELLSDGIDAGDWEIFRNDDSIVLRTTRSLHPKRGRNTQTGKEIQIAAKAVLGPSDNCDTEACMPEVRSIPPAIHGIAIDNPRHPSSTEAIYNENRHVRKKPGRTSNTALVSSTDHGGVLLSARQLVTSNGAWVLAQFGHGYGAGADRQAPLQTSDPKTVFGWLSSTGPFLPIAAPDGGDISDTSDIQFDSKPLDQTTPLLYQFRQAPDDDDSGSIQISKIRVVNDRPVAEDKRTVEVDLSGVTAASKKVVKFKTGAELSKSVNIAAPGGDDDCNDADSCPSPSRVLVAMELEGGKILMGIVDPDSDDDGVMTAEETGLRQALIDELGLQGEQAAALEASWSIYGVGGPPVLALRGTHTADGQTTEAVVTIDRDKQRTARTLDAGQTLHFADVRGEGHDQIVECKVSGGGDDNEMLCGQTDHFASGGSGEGDGDVSAPMSIAGDAIATVIDVDGDGCADLVTNAGELLSSRCDGEFAAAVQLGPWALHMPGAQRAQDYNAARSNKPTSIAVPDLGGDDDSFGGALPFFDGLEVPTW
jgi:hypothetical protein